MRLPIGYDNFAELIRERFDFVDKSLFIREILEGDKVTLITRPRRFGKTLNLSMLQCFFAAEVNRHSTKGLFDTLKITQAGEQYMQHQGKYPVIFISFKGVRGKTYEEAYGGFCKVLSQLYTHHQFLLDSPHIYDHEKEVYYSILKQEATLPNIKTALQDFTFYLYRHYGIAPVVLIDEYDTPIQTGYLHGYYEEIVDVFRDFFGEGLKGNPYFFKAVLTGILRVSKESLFSGLNNLTTYTVLQSRYSPYFGFTEEEVTDLLNQAGLQDKAADIKDWYNGYQIGNSVLYNPWSIVNCIQNEGATQPYWINTSGNDLIRVLLLENGVAFEQSFTDLIEGKSIEGLIDENFVFNDLKKNNESAIWTLLLMAGYLKSLSSRPGDLGTFCQLAIPNLEVRNLYKKVIVEWLSNGDGFIWYLNFLRDLLAGDIDAFQKGLTHILDRTVSVHDTAFSPEIFYHGLMVGLTASLYDNPDYIVQSNREAGQGRYDLMIFCKKLDKPTLLFEFKKADVSEAKKNRELSLNTLQQTAQIALKQIEQQQYFVTAREQGAQQILKIGLAFAGKRFALAYEKI